MRPTPLALILILFALLQFPLKGFSQYDVLTQPSAPSGATNPEYVATSNIGQFIVSGPSTSLRLVGGTGQVINQTGTIASTVNLAVATNHDTYVAVVSGTNVVGGTAVSVRVWNNNSGSGDGGLRMLDPNVLVGVAPGVAASSNLPAGIGDVARVEATMDKDNLYIAFHTSTRRIGFAVFSLASKSFIVPATKVLASTGPNVDAIGSMPTITCHRWSTGTATSLNCHVAWVQDIGTVPMDFQPTLPFNPGTSVRTILPSPPIPHNAVYVRAISTDYFSGPNFTHYFIGTHNPASGECRLYAASTATLFGPITNTLVHTPNNFNPIPPPAAADPYNIWVGGAQSVFCVYQDHNGLTPPTAFRVNVVRQEGLNNQLINSAPSQASFYTAGANQMGWFSIFDNGGSSNIWRNFKVIADNIQENTLITGYNELVPHILPDVYITPEDTLRVFGHTSDATRKLKFTYPLTRLNVGWNWAHSSFNASHQRAHLMLDENGILDFNNQPDCEIRVNGRGSLEYNGSSLMNQNQTILSGLGNQRVADTTSANRALLDFNAPCTITNGSRMELTKSHLNFIRSAATPHPALFSVEGTNSSILWDSTFVVLGSTKTTGPSTQIVMDENATESHGQQLVIKDSRVRTHDQYNLATSASTWYGIPGGRNRSDIMVYRPDLVKIVRSKLVFTYFYIKDAVSSIQFDSNDISVARNSLKCYASSTPSSTFTLRVRENWTYETWPIGTTTDSPIDWEFENFDQSDLSQVVVQSNVLHRQLTNVPTGSWTGIYFSSGTNGNILDNLIYGRNPGIHTTGPTGTRPLLCGNTLEGCCESVGIQHSGASHGYSKSNTSRFYQIGYLTTDDDETLLLGNLLEDNTITGLKVTGDAITDLRGSHTGGDDYPGRNILQDNGDSQLEVASNGQPKLGPTTGVATPANWGQNIFSNSSSAIHLKRFGSSPITLSTPVSFNQWSPGILTGSPVAVNTDPEIEDIIYTNTSAGSGSGSYFCGISSSPAGSLGQTQATTPECTDETDSLCLYSKGMYWFNLDFQKSYDTLKLYCEAHPHAYQFPGEL